MLLKIKKGLKIMADDSNKLMTPEELKQLTSDILSDVREIKQRIYRLESLFEQYNNDSSAKRK